MNQVVAGHMAFGQGYRRCCSAAPACRTPPPRPPSRTDAKGVKSLHDGPFAETKEQLGGFYMIEADDLDDAVAIAKQVPVYREGAIEIRPLLGQGQRKAGWKSWQARWIWPRCLAAGRVIGAFLAARFRDLDLAEEAFSEACLAAARAWPQTGEPGDPAAWPIAPLFAGHWTRCAGVGSARGLDLPAPDPSAEERWPTTRP